MTNIHGGFYLLGFYAIDKVRAKVQGLAQAALKKLKNAIDDSDEMRYLFYGDGTRWSCAILTESGTLQACVHSCPLSTHLRRKYRINLSILSHYFTSDLHGKSI
jgi:hypothetical protein